MTFYQLVTVGLITGALGGAFSFGAMVYLERKYIGGASRRKMVKLLSKILKATPESDDHKNLQSLCESFSQKGKSVDACPVHHVPFWEGTHICPVCREEFLSKITEGVPEEAKKWLMTRDSVIKGDER